MNTTQTGTGIRRVAEVWKEPHPLHGTMTVIRDGDLLAYGVDEADARAMYLIIRADRDGLQHDALTLYQHRDAPPEATR